MLTHIFIRDLATITELSLQLDQGLSMITGETGAGKSIFIEAIQLGLGGRASANLIRAQKDKAEISLSFNIAAFEKVIAKLQSLDLYQDNEECIIRRVLTQDGRSRCYVNGTPVNVQLVKELGELLFHLHSQHDQQILLKSDTQREMLDRYADALTLANQVKMLAENWRELEDKLTLLKNRSAERASKCEFLRFQLEELRALAIEKKAWEQLEAEHHRLTHQEEFAAQIGAIKNLVQEDENSIISLLNQLNKLFANITTYHPNAKNWHETINQTLIQLKDLYAEVKQIDDHELNPEVLFQVEQRIGQLFTLARKYKTTPQELAAFRDKIAAELNELLQGEEDIETFAKQQTQIYQDYQKVANSLSTLRKQSAAKLEQEINAVIRSLSLPHGEFKISFLSEPNEMALHGKEKMQFLIKTNPDQELQALSKVISGGELSRLSLAAHLALAHRTTIPTLIFDEVDTGVSGSVAEKIGKLLRKLGNSYQVFCITHQPQVAAFGEHHLLVEKTVNENKSHTQIQLLNKQEKAREIARMLGGENITAKTLAHAKEVIEHV